MSIEDFRSKKVRLRLRKIKVNEEKSQTECKNAENGDFFTLLHTPIH